MNRVTFIAHQHAPDLASSVVGEVEVSLRFSGEVQPDSAQRMGLVNRVAARLHEALESELKLIAQEPCRMTQLGNESTPVAAGAQIDAARLVSDFARNAAQATCEALGEGQGLTTLVRRIEQSRERAAPANEDASLRETLPGSGS